MGAAGTSAEEAFLKVLPLAVHSQISKQECMKGSQQKSSGELGPELKIPVGSKDLTAWPSPVCMGISVMRWKSPNQIYKYSSVGRACSPG